MGVWLVVSNDFFHNIWDVILPIDFHIFQDGFCTTNQTFFSPTYQWIAAPPCESERLLE